MTTKQAAIILDDFVCWQKGEIEDLPYAKHVVEKAIEVAINDINKN